MPVVLSHGRFLRAVLRGRQAGRARARHRADQARPPPGRRHPDVRGAGAQRRELSRAPDQTRLQGRDLRADRGPGCRPQARRQIAGRARRDPGGHPRHADRGQPARGEAAQLPRRPRAQPAYARARLARHLDRRFSDGAGRGRHARGRARPDRAGRAAPARGAARSGGAPDRLARPRRTAHALARSRVRFASRRAPAQGELRGRGAGRLRCLLPRRARRERGAARLRRADPEGPVAAPRPAQAGGARHASSDRRRDAAQSRALDQSLGRASG